MLPYGSDAGTIAGPWHRVNNYAMVEPLMPPRRSSRGQKPSQAKKTIQGVISINRRGTGFVAWPLPEGAAGIKLEKKQDIEIATNYLNGALNGDEVEIEVKGLFPRPQGAVVKIMSRAKEAFVATVKREGQNYIAIAADQRFYKPIELV